MLESWIRKEWGQQTGDGTVPVCWTLTDAIHSSLENAILFSFCRNCISNSGLCAAGWVNIPHEWIKQPVSIYTSILLLVIMIDLRITWNSNRIKEVDRWLKGYECVYSSSKRPEFRFQHPCQVSHILLELQFW